MTGSITLFMYIYEIQWYNLRCKKINKNAVEPYALVSRHNSLVLNLTLHYYSLAVDAFKEALHSQLISVIPSSNKPSDRLSGFTLGTITALGSVLAAIVYIGEV